MHEFAYRYRFSRGTDLEQVELTIAQAIEDAESLHGESGVRLDAGYAIDRSNLTCVIDASTPVGRDINRLFAGAVTRQWGEDSFEVQRVSRAHNASPHGKTVPFN